MLEPLGGYKLETLCINYDRTPQIWIDDFHMSGVILCEFLETSINEDNGRRATTSATSNTYKQNTDYKIGIWTEPSLLQLGQP